MSLSCMFLCKRVKLISIKEMHLTDVLCELPCRIYEFLFLKIPCCMKGVRKSKEIELCCIIFKAHGHCRFVMDVFTFSSTTKCGFDFEVNCCH